jgi:two-component system chemotaxis response regulator CheY
MNILLVDDSKTMRNIQQKVLAEMGDVTFAEAADGVEALKILQSGATFDLVLVDWNMPNMNGHELVNKVRATDKTTPLVMCTTEAEKSRVVEAIKAGVNNYVIKPFTPQSLMEKVNATLAKAKAA